MTLNTSVMPTSPVIYTCHLHQDLDLSAQGEAQQPHLAFSVLLGLLMQNPRDGQMLSRLAFGLSQGQVVWEEEGEGHPCLVSRRRKGPRQSCLARSFMCKPGPSAALLTATPIPHFLLHQEGMRGNWEGAWLPIWCEAHIPLQYPGVACLPTPGWNNNEWEAPSRAGLPSAVRMLC